VSGAPPTQHSRPLWLAALITALLTPAIFFGVLLAINLVRGEASGELAFRGMGFLIFFGLPLSLGATYLVGLPLALLLRSQQLLAPKYVIPGAALVGATILSVLTLTILRTTLTLQAIAVGLGVGAVAGIVFCLTAGIAFRLRATRAAT